MTAILPEPLHPAVVHFPIVLALALPVAAVSALWVARRRADARHAWAVVVILGALLLGASWLAVQTGEAQEEVVEAVVAETPLEAHEEAGERFLILSGIAFGLIALGLLPGTAGRSARIVGAAAALGLTVAGWSVGHTGGELVYRHGAASAWAATGAEAGPEASWRPAPDASPETGARGGEREERDDDEVERDDGEEERG